MELEIIPSELTICKLSSTHNLPFDASFFFLGKTDQEVSLVCKTEDTPAETLDREDGWRGFRIKGILDFTQIGVFPVFQESLRGTRSAFLLFQHTIPIIFS